MAFFPVKIQQLDPNTEAWTDLKTLHAIKVNRTGGTEQYAAGADQYHPSLDFTFQHSSTMENIAYNTQQYRLVYRGHYFNIKAYDDYMERHRTVILTGVAYGA